MSWESGAAAPPRPVRRSIAAYPTIHAERYELPDVEALIWGGRDSRGERVHAWEALRSIVETHGNLDQEGWADVLDLERALKLMCSPAWADGRRRRHEMQARRAAMLISAHLMLGLDRRDLASLVPVGEDPVRLMRAGATWIVAFLNGRDPAECDRAFADAIRGESAA